MSYQPRVGAARREGGAFVVARRGLGCRGGSRAPSGNLDGGEVVGEDDGAVEVVGSRASPPWLLVGHERRDEVGGDQRGDRAPGGGLRRLLDRRVVLQDVLQA